MTIDMAIDKDVLDQAKVAPADPAREQRHFLVHTGFSLLSIMASFPRNPLEAEQA